MELTGINVELVDQPRPLPASHDLHLGLLRGQSITRPEQTPWATQKSQVIWSYLELVQPSIVSCHGLTHHAPQGVWGGGGGA